MRLATLPIVLRLAAFASLTQVACATTHEEPPAPPPPPVDTAAFNGPARPPAANVDIGADLDAGNLWADSSVPAGPASSTDGGGASPVGSATAPAGSATAPTSSATAPATGKASKSGKP